MNVTFGQKVYCVAAEPDATLLRIGVTDGRREVAYETAVMSRLRGGYRVVQLRGPLGTRIELAYLLLHISFGVESNVWPTVRQVSTCIACSMSVAFPIAAHVVYRLDRPNGRAHTRT